MAPECIAGTRYDAAADVYSFGMTLYEVSFERKTSKNKNKNKKQMLSRTIPYSDGAVSHFQLPGKIVEGYRPKMPSDEHHPALLRLVVGCWDAKPATRPTFADIARIIRETFPTL